MPGYGHPDGNVFYRKLGHRRPMISHGRGLYLFDQDGNRYLDGSGGAIVVNLGHGLEEIADAVREQMAAVGYIHGTMFTGETLERYSEELAGITPMERPRFYFLTSGSEAVEGAIKFARHLQLARGYPQRHLIIGRHQSYHGLTFGALSVSDRPWFRTPYLPMFQDMPHIRPPYSYRYPVTGEEAAGWLEECILEQGPERVAAFIAEPISGASLGAAVPPNDYWPCIRAICDRYGVLLIADEVMTGFGRTGRWWAMEHWSVAPDIFVTSKGATSGYFPLSIMAVKEADVDQIAASFGDFSHGGTFSHHIVGAAAGLAALKIMKRDRLVEHSARIGALLGAELHSALGEFSFVGDVRGRGLLWGIELVSDRGTREPFKNDHQVASRVAREAFKEGLIVYPSHGCANGRDGDLIMVGPPLIIDQAGVDELVEKFSAALASCFLP